MTSICVFLFANNLNNRIEAIENQMKSDNIEHSVALFIKKTYEILEVTSISFRSLTLNILFSGCLPVKNLPSRTLRLLRRKYFPLSSDIGIFILSYVSSICMASINLEKIPQRTSSPTKTLGKVGKISCIL